MTSPKLATEVKGYGRMYPRWDGASVPSVTNVLKNLDSSGPLMWWAARTAVEHVAENADDFVEAVRYGTSLNPFIGSYRKKRDDAADAGTSVHDWLETAIADPGRLLEVEVNMSADARRFLPAAEAFIDDCAPIGRTEMTVVSPRYGGTGDLRGDLQINDPEQPVGITLTDYIVDYKTRGNDKHDVYEKEHLQLAALRWAEMSAELLDDGTINYEQIDPAAGAALVTLTPTNGYRVHDLSEQTGIEALGAFGALIDVWEWKRWLKESEL